MSWVGFKYAPIQGIIERIERRALRARRRALLRVFIEKGQLDLVAQTRTLRDNSALSGSQKIAQFQRIYNEFRNRIIGAQASASGEATSLSAAGAVGLSGA